MAFTPERCLRIKLLSILETAGEPVLRYTLHCGTDGKLDKVPLNEYLQGLPYSSTANFNKIIAKHVKKRLDASDYSDTKKKDFASSDDLDNEMILKFVKKLSAGHDDLDEAILKHVKELSAGSDDLANELILKLVKELSDRVNDNNKTLKLVKELSASSDDLKKMLKKVHIEKVEKQFNATEQNQITSDPFCGAFDITLLHKTIKLACENVAEMHKETWKTESSEMEYLVTKIKDHRNYIVHEKPAFSELEYLDKVKEFQDLFYKALEATAVRYNRGDSELSVKKDEISGAVDDVVKSCIGIEEILRRSPKTLRECFIEEANKEIKDRLDYAKSLNPLHFLSSAANTQVDVHDIFSRIIVKREGKDEKIDHLKLMTLTQKGRSLASPHLMMIEGDAGSGKTTLLTFLLAEWLKEEPHRSMEGLHHFDLLLWVVCRHETSTTLESLAVNGLPDVYIKFRDLLLPLLKKCSILFAVDGLDEVTEFSRKLTADIMSHGKDCPTFTVVCTSRPEGLMGMKGKTPPNFKVFHTRIEGIAIEERTEFIVRHIDQLSRCSGVPEDTDHLRQVLEQIVWREIFRLPLNLLFLVYLYMEEPQELTARITQTKLYRDIIDWSVEKLHHRMAGGPQEKFLRDNISNILRLICAVSLEELLHGNIHLSDKNLSSIKSACGNECIKEVLSAFFCLRRERARFKEIEKYSAPHKGIQEYLAARSITERLDKYKQGDIRRLLQDYMQEQVLHLPFLRNFFCQLLGILSSQEKPKVMAIIEAVDLVHKSGVEDIQDWLTLLADTEAGDDAMKQVAHHIIYHHDLKKTEGEVTVRDGTVQVAAALLPLLPCKKIYIDLQMDVVRVGDVLFPALEKHTVEDLCLWHHYRNPPPPAASANLLQHFPWSGLSRFIGNLHAKQLPRLPRGLLDLRLGVTGEKEVPELLSQLQHVHDYCPDLRSLWIHVPVLSVTAASLSPLPDPHFGVSLLLSGVGDGEIEAACRIAAAMCPREEGYWDIRFPGASLDFDRYRRLLEGLRGADVKVWGSVAVPDTAAIAEAEEEKLKTLAKTLLGCIFVRAKEDLFWNSRQ